MRKTAFGCVNHVLKYHDSTVHIALRLNQPALAMYVMYDTNGNVPQLPLHIHAHTGRQ